MKISPSKNSNKLKTKFASAELAVYPESIVVNKIEFTDDFSEKIVTEVAPIVEVPSAIFMAGTEAVSLFSKVKKALGFNKNQTPSTEIQTAKVPSLFKIEESQSEIITSSYRSDLLKIFPKTLGQVEVEIGQNTASSLLSTLMFGIEFFKDVEQSLKIFQLNNGVGGVQVSTSVESKNVHQILDFELKNHNHIIWVAIFSQKIIPLLSKKLDKVGGKITGYHQRKLTENKNFFTIMVTHEKIVDLKTTPVEVPVVDKKQNSLYVAKAPMEL